MGSKLVSIRLLTALNDATHNGGSSSVVERQLPKLNVAGSIPVSRSNSTS